MNIEEKSFSIAYHFTDINQILWSHSLFTCMCYKKRVIEFEVSILNFITIVYLKKKRQNFPENRLYS